MTDEAPDLPLLELLELLPDPLEPEPEPEPPKELKPLVEAPDEPVAVELIDELLVELTRVGFWAPQGWSCRQLLAHALSWPHPATHWLPHSVHS